LSGIQQELGPKGLQVVEAAINGDNPDVPGFIQRFKPLFPVGAAKDAEAHTYLQMGITERAFVPLLVMIDRQGNIRYQHTGTEQQYFDDDYFKQMANLRREIETLLAESSKASRTAVQGRRAAKK
jgi:hypothetical protein